MGSEPTLDNEVAGFLADVRATYVSEPEEASPPGTSPRSHAKPNWFFHSARQLVGGAS